MSNNTLIARLKEVFDLCDTEKKGYISVDHFIELATEFTKANGQSNTKFVDRMVSVLDSEGNGKISFQEFCNGVTEILQSNPESLQNNSDDMNNTVINDFLGRRMSVEDPKVLASEIFETDDSPNLMMFDDIDVSGHVVDHSTPRPIDNSHLRINQSLAGSVEEDADSGSWSATPQEINWPPKDKARFQNSHYSNGQNFNNNNNNSNYYDEDCEDERGRASFVRNYPSTSLSTPRSSMRSIQRVSAPASRSGSFRKSVTPSAVASQLYRSTQNCSDFYNDPDDEQLEMKEKITKLEEQLQSLNESRKKNEDDRLKLKDESAFMVERVHILEEQLRDMEITNEERFKEEQKKHRELMMKTEKDKTNQIEILSQSLKLIEGEYNTLKTEVPRLKSENDQYKRSNFSLERELAKLRQECSELNDEKLTLHDLMQAEQTKINKERLAHSQLLDELTLELNDLRQFKAENLRHSPAQKKDNEMPRTLKAEMEAQIIKLKTENANLKEQLEELQAILLNRQIEEGQALIQNHDSSFNTLAAELEEVPKNELMQALQREQDSNRKLREYIENLTLRILESNPNLLEIHGRKKADKKTDKKADKKQ